MSTSDWGRRSLIAPRWMSVGKMVLQTEVAIKVRMVGPQTAHDSPLAHIFPTVTHDTRTLPDRSIEFCVMYLPSNTTPTHPSFARTRNQISWFVQCLGSNDALNQNFCHDLIRSSSEVTISSPSLSPPHLHICECDKSASLSFRHMVSLLQDLYVRFRYARGSGSWLKMLTWRSSVLLLVGFGFLVTLYRTYVLPSHSWSIDPEEEVEFDVPDQHIDWTVRANAVKQAFAHAYHGYEKYAFPEDELLPLTNSSGTR